MSVRADPRVGTELAGYRIEALLGRGGMADVYRAVDLRLGRPVALKLLAPDLAEDERFRERFLRESRLAASLDHPNVIPIYEAGEVEGLLYIAMRYVEGTDLKKLLHQEGRLDPRRALFLLGRIADALDAAHSRGLVHRDVKPGNVLIAVDPKADPPEHPYLSDFGLTKQASSDSGITQTGQFVGTADYAAPEQITRGPIGPATDQYALACLLYEALTGAPPYRNDALMAVLWAHVNDSPPKASEQNAALPKAIDPVLARGLSKKPEQRYGSCRELVANARDALGLSSGELPLAPAATTPLLRRREFLIGAGALVAAAAAVPAVLLTRGGGQERYGPRASQFACPDRPGVQRAHAGRRGSGATLGVRRRRGRRLVAEPRKAQCHPHRSGDRLHDRHLHPRPPLLDRRRRRSGLGHDELRRPWVPAGAGPHDDQRRQPVRAPTGRSARRHGRGWGPLDRLSRLPPRRERHPALPAEATTRRQYRSADLHVCSDRPALVDDDHRLVRRGGRHHLDPHGAARGF